MKKIFTTFILTIFTIYSFSQDMKNIKRDGVINVAFTESWKNTVNYTLAQEFAKFLDVDFNEVTISWEEIFSNNGNTPSDYQTNPNIHYTPDALKKADIICGTVYVLDWRKKFFDFSGIMQISDLLLTKKSVAKKIKTFENLKGLKIAFLEKSTYETNIKQINEKIGGGIQFVVTKSEEESLKLLQETKWMV
jgi:hypothetical protein